jgi:hypothetical protein
MKRRVALRQDGHSKQSLIGAMLERLRRGRDLRRTKVRRIRRSLGEQSYENELKLEVAVERLVREMEG